MCNPFNHRLNRLSIMRSRTARVLNPLFRTLREGNPLSLKARERAGRVLKRKGRESASKLEKPWTFIQRQPSIARMRWTIT